MSNDLINGGFELVGAVMVWLSVLALYRQKEVRGVFWPSWAFFAAWGMWNLHYYPSLEQMVSFYAGLLLVSGNVAWVVLALYYRRAARVEVIGIRKISA